MTTFRSWLISKYIQEYKQTITFIGLWKCTYVYGGTCGVIVINLKNGDSDPSSNPDEDVCISHSTNILLERYVFNYSSFSYKKIVGQRELFNPGMAASLGEGKLNSNLLNWHLKFHLVSHSAYAEGLVNTYVYTGKKSPVGRA